ncbi:GNAT family N-acetyltransferase [Stutzerimonas nitrititolerans]|uniref:GNAT family N-acetyltransferase n=1 Tax=Stutzerimonas nitrititolerans TaxID=2482751 RepID=UPI0028993CD5|nr:GNAT family N-acetyltransferase [Stutzerimonas nitrititolerans]
MTQIIQKTSICKAAREDLPDIVKVHQQAFPGFLMTLLGPAFLYAYYQTVLDYPDSIFLVVRDEKDVIQGFVAGVAYSEGFYRLLSTRKKRMMLSAAIHLIIRPQLWLRVLENMKLVSQRSSSEDCNSSDVELTSIGVKPDCGRRGYGKILVRSFLEESQATPATYVHLATDAHNNVAVNEFYLSLGFSLANRSERAGGRLMNHYKYRLKTS